MDSGNNNQQQLNDEMKKIQIINPDQSNGNCGTDLEYWRKDISEFKQVSNIVLIHVCDENRSENSSSSSFSLINLSCL
jgi:hypothetical protein